GTGLGLSQVYGFARSSGGEVRFDSVLGEGTTVALLLPRSRKPLPRPATDDAASAPNPDRQRRILVVEDDASVAELVIEMLRELGFEVERAASAEEAIELLDKGSRTDLVLSDMVMPGKFDGLGLAHVIAERWPSMPVILMSGY